MKKITIILGMAALLSAASLQEFYDAASSGEGYDKHLILSDSISYTGGFIQAHPRVKISGNGAYLDLQGDSIVVAGAGKILDIERVVFHNSLLEETIFVHYRDDASGTLQHNTFFGKYGYGRANGGVRFTNCLNVSSVLQNNIFAGLSEPLFFVSDTTLSDDDIPLHVAWNILYDCCSSYLVYGGWEGPARYFVPYPGDGERYEEIGFTDEVNRDLSLGRYSPCVDAGLDWGQSFLGNAPDLGALESEMEFYHGKRVQGEVSGRWSPWEGPYILMDDCEIPAGELLSVSPGTEIRINYGKHLVVKGNLELMGDAVEPVLLRRNSFFHNQWGSLLFEEGGSSWLQYVQFENGGDTLLYVAQDSVVLSHSHFSDSVLVKGESRFILREMTFSGSLFQEGGLVSLEHSQLQNAKIVTDSGRLILKGNEIQGSALWGNGASIRSLANRWQEAYQAVKVMKGAFFSANELFLNVQYPFLISGSASAKLVNNTILGMKGGLWATDSASAEIHNSMIWSDTDDAEYALRNDSMATLTSSYCILYEHFPGENHIYEAPLFRDQANFDFYPDSLSPALDAGTPDTCGLGLPALDFAAAPRISNSRIDIGAYEYQFAEPVKLVIQAESANLLQLYPNPFNGLQRVRINMTEPLQKVNVYNLQGRLVRELFHSESETHRYDGSFDGRNQFGEALPSGIYLLQAKSENSVLNQRILLLK